MPNLCSPERALRYRLHKRTGQAVVTIDGKDIYLGKHRSAASREMDIVWSSLPLIRMRACNDTDLMGRKNHVSKANFGGEVTRMQHSARKLG